MIFSKRRKVKNHKDCVIVGGFLMSLHITAIFLYFPDLTANWKTIANFMQALLHSFEHKGLSLGLSVFARACEQFAVLETLSD